MLTLLFVYFVVPDTSFVLVVVVAVRCWHYSLSTSSFPTHRSSSLSSLLLHANTTLCLLRRSRHIVRPRCRRCDWMLSYYLCTSSFPEASFVVLLVVVAVVWMLSSSLCTSSFPRRGSSSSSLSLLLLEVTLLCVLRCADRSHTLPRGISPLLDHESPIICRGNVERSYTATVTSAC
jgi:glucose-6-phosphate-specific signal transduction histidine kinase